MTLNDRQVLDIMLRESYVSQDDARKAEEHAERYNASPVDYLLSARLVTKDIIGQAIAESRGIPYADLNSYPPPREKVLRIEEAAAKADRVVIFKEDDKGTVIASDDPDRAAAYIEKLRALDPSTIFSLSYSLPEDMDRVFMHYLKPLETRFAKIIAAEQHIAPEILDEVFADAVSHHASDIHFEPHGIEVLIRFRVDGILREAGKIPKEHYENILNRIKVKANMRIDEHSATQDGAIRYEKGGTAVDMRISVAPTVEGETIVIRLLSEYVRSFTMTDLGLSQKDQGALEDAAKRPFGMILVAGPTGSGKTTTLYSVVKILNRPELNVMTIEDPVEYKIKGLNQIQVNAKAGLTFANGLRSIVRQDPNVILVGEIRDRETAEIAVNAALTGHLLLSTVHSNDASTVVPRILDMGVEPFLLASTLEVIVAQRLVRAICDTCRAGTEVKRSDLALRHPKAVSFFEKEACILYAGKGCSACGGAGYKGRVGIYEIIRATPEIRELILKNPSAQQVWAIARQQGSRALFEDGLEKAKLGITTIDEVERVAAPTT